MITYYEYWEAKFKKQRELVSQIEAAKEAYNQNLNPTENLRKWAFALTELANTLGETRVDSLKCLKDAQPMLERVLQNDPHDYEAIFHLGLLHYYRSFYDETLLESNEALKECCTAAIENLEKVHDKFYQPPWGHEVYDLLHEMSMKVVTLSPVDPPPLSPLKYFVDEDDDSVKFSYECYLVKELKAVKRENAKNPNNADNLRRWASALINLAYYHECSVKKRKMAKEAIAKLEHAYKIKPNKETRLQLLDVHLQMRFTKKEKSDDLLKEYRKLREELATPHVAEGSRLVACQAGKAISKKPK